MKARKTLGSDSASMPWRIRLAATPAQVSSRSSQVSTRFGMMQIGGQRVLGRDPGFVLIGQADQCGPGLVGR